MLYESNEEFIPLEKELEYINNYIELERLRSDKKADIKIEINGNADECLIPPFLILPLLENAIKHGLKSVDDTAFLYLKINIGKELEIKLINSKPGSILQERKGGIGLKNLRERLQLLYPGRHELHTEDGVGKYQAILKIIL